MWVLRTCVDVKIVDNLVSEAGFREHSLDSHPDEFGRALLKDLLRCGEALSARITGVAGVNAVGHLVTLESHLLGVDDDDVVTTVNVRSEARLVLATEDESNS